MCLAVPGKVIETFQENDLLMGGSSFGGTILRACLVYVPEVQVGQYVIVHAGFALSVIDEAEAQKTLALFESSANPRWLSEVSRGIS